ncbi:MAG TPA: ABC transporter substrate-binding protein [Polyangiaceae bacterium]|jgi:phospholipid transport system substrate-binding protein
MNPFRRTRLFLSVFALAFALCATAFASEAQDFVKSKQVELTELVSKSKSVEDEKKVLAAFDSVLDYDALAKDTLKDFWDERTPAEREEFSTLLKDLVRNAYRRNIKKTMGYDVDYTGETDADLGKTIKTVAHNRKKVHEEPVDIDYLVHQVGGQWRIRDIVTEGSSLVTNYRNQFRRIIKKHGFPELLKKMKAKRDKGDID